MSAKELWSRVWPLVVVTLIVLWGWHYLANLAMDARNGTGHPTFEDYDKSIEWATALLGLAGTFAGFLGISGAAQRLGVSALDRTASAHGGMIGVLAGATLLGVGGWPVPAALAAMATGVAGDRIIRTLRARDV